MQITYKTELDNPSVYQTAIYWPKIYTSISKIINKKETKSS